MAKVIIAGDVAVITSDFSKKEIETVEKYRPNALTLYGGEDGKEPVFTVMTTKSAHGSIDANGVAFNGETHDDQKLATVTVCANGCDGDIREYIADKIGGALVNLNKVESRLAETIAEIIAEKESVLASITVAQ